MIAIVDYRAGNLRSVERALRKIGFQCRITCDREDILAAERVVFPGVGAAGRAMDHLRQAGLDLVLRQVFENGRPFLGICIGAQIILDVSDEDHASCLGLLPGRVRAFPSPLESEDQRPLKIPHMGWNGLDLLKDHPVLRGVRPEDEFYFVHSYYPMPASGDHVMATTDYGIRFPSVIGTGNLIATQFHVEKSGAPGLRILENFCQWDGETC